MKNILKNTIHPIKYAESVHLLLLLLRLIVGVFMLTHGIGKLQSFFGNGPIQFHDPLGVGATTSLFLAVFAEVFCSILLILGLLTRLATIPILFTMMIAAFVIHFQDGFGKQELPLLYAAIYITITVLGAGKYSLDYILLKRKKISII